MTSEMDLLRMDERQRLAWLMANRGALIAVGATWIGLIVYELAHSRMPLFLIVMVPVFALLRAGLFFYYCRAPMDLSGEAGRLDRGRLLKMLAAAMLAACVVLPLYRFDPHAQRKSVELGFSWDLVHDWMDVTLLAIALLWPLATLILSRSRSRRLSVAAHLAEPLLAALSVLLLLWIPQFQWEGRTLWVFFLGFESARPALGTYVGVAANGLYFVIWLWETLRSFAPRPSG